MEPESKVLGRCWELRLSRPDGPLWRRKGSWSKVYQRTSLPLGATRQTHTSEQRGERDCMSRWESLAGSPHIQLGASPGGAVRMSRNGGVPLQAVGRV